MCAVTARTEVMVRVSPDMASEPKDSPMIPTTEALVPDGTWGNGTTWIALHCFSVSNELELRGAWMTGSGNNWPRGPLRRLAPMSVQRETE